MQHVMHVRSALPRFAALCAPEYLTLFVNIRDKCALEQG
jgi:hypothetical protein